MKFLRLFLIFGIILSSNTWANDKGRNCYNGNSIYEVAKSAGGFSTLLTALRLTGLDEVMKAKGNYTVFAPNDDAFSKLPPETLDYLINNPEELKSILLYHVAGKRLKAKDVVAAKEVETLLGKMIRVNVSNDGAFLNESQIIATDIKACNGVIHVLDSVLVPNENTPDNDPQTAEYVDLMKYVGTWYEIARLEQRFQKGCVSSKAIYKLKRDKVKVTNVCKKANGRKKKAKGIAIVKDKETNSKLFVSFVPFFRNFGLFGGDYWIIDIDEEYQWAIVGDAKRESLWFLSRTPEISKRLYKRLKRKAEKQGFDTSELIKDIPWK